MSDRAFTLDAIATCEARGHRYAWVPTWGECGFEECSTCGETRRHGRRDADDAQAIVSLGPDGMHIDQSPACDARERRLALARKFSNEVATWSSKKLRQCYAQPEAVKAAEEREARANPWPNRFPDEVPLHRLADFVRAPRDHGN